MDPDSLKNLQGRGVALLKAHGLRKTPARLAIAGLFLGQVRPWGIKDILKIIPKGVANYVTVYRNVQTFVEAGMLREINLRHGHVDYELADTHDHHHLVCERCGLIEEFTGCGADQLAKSVLRRSKSFISVREHAIELFGRCKICSKAV